MPQIPFSDEYVHRRDGVDSAQDRRVGRTYTSRTFENARAESQDFGQPSRFVYRVFDDDGEAGKLVLDGEEWIVADVSGSRSQVKILVSREAGRVVDLWIQRVPPPGGHGRLTPVLHLHRDDARDLIQFLQQLALIEPEGAETGTRVDDEVLRDLLNDPEAIQRLYASRSEAVHQLIAEDVNAHDIVAVAGRRRVLEEFRSMLEVTETPEGGHERAWQRFFETNPWLLGIGLGSQLLTSWSTDKLEQVVAGFSISGAGKRTDALLRTSGLVRSMVFAEIKHHATPLLRADEYRPDVFAPSTELAGGLAQLEVTTHRAVLELGDRLVGRDEDGYDADWTYLVKPRAFLIVGSLAQLQSEDGQDHKARITSFELFRRSLLGIEVVTFDELLARAEWMVA